MQMVREITLPKTADFYTREYEFPVELVTAACRQYHDPGPPAQVLSLALDPDMQAILTAYGVVHRGTLDDIAGASIQFFRTSDAPTETLDHIELRFLLTYEFGRVLTTGPLADGQHLGPATRDQSQRHGEALKKTSEMFGYGLALHYVAAALGVSTDRFLFILENGARADFMAAHTIDELVAMNPILQTLGPAGERIYVEVKSRIGWGSMREANDNEGLLLHCARKAASCADGILLSVLVALPARSDSPGRTPKILVADPNDPSPLPPEEQAAFLLDCYLLQARRFGLHVLRRNILRWLVELRPDLRVEEQKELAELNQRTPDALTKQPFLPRRTIRGRSVQGRYFYSLIERLGSPRRRRLTLEEAIAATDGRNLGTKYFVGAEEELMHIIARQDLEGLLRFGVRGKGGPDLAGRSAFLEEQLELDQADREEVMRVVGRAVTLWQRTQVW